MGAGSEAEAFTKYLSTRRILIADPSATARSGMFGIFKDLGAAPNQIVLVNTFKQAVDQIAAIRPDIVVAEFELGKRCGLDLLQTQREQNPEATKKMLFVVVTGNTSQSAVARAAEEDIDAYVLKPFTVEVVRKILMKAAITKIQPPPYLVAIEEGKKQIEEGKLDDAEKTFMKARELDPSPSLACYYLGHVKFLRQILDQAKGSFNKGLEYNKIHYKCMVGIYEILMKEKDHEQAYEIVKRISQYFPANPKRLSEVLRLAIANAKYEDVEKYYQVFVNIDERDDTLIKYICAALVVCGKYYLSNKHKQRALELFQKAAATGFGRGKILKEIVQALLDFDLNKDAKAFLAKFPAEAQASPEYLLLRFQVVNSEGNRSLTIEEGRSLLSKGIGDERLYAIMIRASYEAKLTGAAETLYQEAVKKFPNRKTDFDNLLQAYQSAAPAETKKASNA